MPTLELLAILQHIVAADVTKDLLVIKHYVSIKRCAEGNPLHTKSIIQLDRKRSADIPTASSELYEKPNANGLPKRLKNPKITNLIDEILNDTSGNQSEKERPIVIQASLPVPTVTNVQPKTNYDMEVDMTKIKLMKTAIRKSPEVEIEMNLSKKPRTKGDIIGFSDDEQVDELPFGTKGGIIGVWW